ncbi:ABC transporter permease [Candidatus Uhrbacteria bacterium]|nr:ABC transporter permease [Candidatus Uhrbacteria bacterium]
MKNASLIRGGITGVVLLALWQAVSSAGLYNPHLFPAPTSIGRAFRAMVISREWLNDLQSSLVRFGIGFITGNAIGILLGLLTGRSQLFKATLGLLLNYLRSTPSVALIPLAIVWFGIGEMEKIFIVTWGVTFPVWLNTSSGFMEVEQEYVRAAQILGARGWRMYAHVYVPHVLPYIIAGARMGIATGFFALAAAEMSGTSSGIGFRIFYSHQLFRADSMMVAIMTIGLLGIIIDRIFVTVIGRIFPWWRATAV